MLTRSYSLTDSREDNTAGKEVTAGGIPVASRRPEQEGRGIHSWLPLDVTVSATAGRGISVLTVAVTRDQRPFPATSADDGGSGTSAKVVGIPAPAVAGGMSVDVRRSDFSPGEDVGVGIVFSGAQQPDEPGDTYDQEEVEGNDAHGMNPETSREIAIPSGRGHAHKSSPVTRERLSCTRVLAPDVRAVLRRASCAVTARVMAKSLRNERAPVPSCDAVRRIWRKN